MEEVIQMDDDAISDDESEAAATNQQDQQASLMSLIGFNPDDDTVTETTQRRLFPEYIDPFSKLSDSHFVKYQILRQEISSMVAGSGHGIFLQRFCHSFENHFSISNRRKPSLLATFRLFL